tara:strand:+ start:1167 stop:1769 length:603 start_codon:yes stop_codon:yes gene_type:complete
MWIKKLLLILLFLPVLIKAQQYNTACPYDNSVRDTLDFSSAIAGASYDAWIWSGDYVWAIGMKASLTYGITTCIDPFNIRDNDSHISIYPHGGGQYLAFNDDQCSNYQYHSTVIFSPPVDGDYDILFDEHTGVYCSHLSDPFEFYDYYIEVLGATSIKEFSTKKELLKITDLLGRETNKKNQPLLYIYNDGTVEKKITIH